MDKRIKIMLRTSSALTYFQTEKKASKQHKYIGCQCELEPDFDFLTSCLYEARIEAEVEANSKTGKITLAFIRSWRKSCQYRPCLSTTYKSILKRIYFLFLYNIVPKTKIICGNLRIRHFNKSA